MKLIGLILSQFLPIKFGFKYDKKNGFWEIKSWYPSIFSNAKELKFCHFCMMTQGKAHPLAFYQRDNADGKPVNYRCCICDQQPEKNHAND